MRTLIHLVTVTLLNFFIFLPFSAWADSLPCDFDGNAHATIVAGAPGRQVDGTLAAGAVYIKSATNLGIPTLLEDGDELLENPQAGAGVGEAIACGDFDDDGAGDLAIGAPGRHGTKGSVTVIYGLEGVGLDPATKLEITEDRLLTQVATVSEAGDYFGQALTVGDFNNDNIDDLAIGAPGDHLVSPNILGAAFVVFGKEENWQGTGPKLTADARYVPPKMIDLICRQPIPIIPIEGVITFHSFNGNPQLALAAGNFNGSGGDELAIGLPECGPIGYQALPSWNAFWGYRGIVDIARWNPDSDNFDNDSTALMQPINIEHVNDGFGAALAAGDLNRSNKQEELIVGAPAEAFFDKRRKKTTVTFDTGKVYIYSGNSDGTFEIPTIISPASFLEKETAYARFGTSLAVGDMNGDNQLDLAVGQPQQNDWTSCDTNKTHERGAVWLLRNFNSTNTPSLHNIIAPPWKLTGQSVITHPLFGDRVAFIDGDGDGIDDLVVGDPGQTYGFDPQFKEWPNFGNSVGSVYLFRGTDSLPDIKTPIGGTISMFALSPQSSFYAGSWFGGWVTADFSDCGDAPQQFVVVAPWAGELLGAGLGQ